MSRSNYNKPFYVDVGTSVVAIRCASNHDIVVRYDYMRNSNALELAENACNRMNKEAEIGRPLRNCDVGTAKEQYEMFDRFCDKYENCNECPVWRGGGLISGCYSRWSQMPYDEVKR